MSVRTGQWHCRAYHTKYGSALPILEGWIRSQHRAKVVVVHLVLVHVDEVSPLLFASLALHLIFVDCSLEIKVRELSVEVLEDIIVKLGQAQFGSWELLED